MVKKLPPKTVNLLAYAATIAILVATVMAWLDPGIRPLYVEMLKLLIQALLAQH
ncbi:hypothetical protein I8748_00585 [Nostoc sp. CENA67]|uniref:Uncharacterized protein n=1 Tax=Amazonocrinis nigriterrae CENA67 TaxID=2794033 RepID=A0A8J7HNL6_9NOST|nr:hypothetical protein [Amazonocrinis nigriterrae]MBH8560718.1 hypothetical protein [Amazonocrinis nigriterrae CENA67]